MACEYKETFKITYFGTDNQLKLTPIMMLVYFQDLAISHSNKIGYTLDYLSQVKRGWALTNWHLDIKRYPKYGEQIEITTWCNSCKRMQAYRCFEVSDENGETLALATSKWVFMDLIRRRPLKITEKMEKDYVCDKKSPLEEDYNFGEINANADFKQREFVITRRDTDSNNHVNNVKYVEWALDDIDDEIYDNSDIVSLKVVYKKECNKGTSIITKNYMEHLSDSYKKSHTFILDKDDNSKIYSEVVSILKLRN